MPIYDMYHPNKFKLNISYIANNEIVIEYHYLKNISLITLWKIKQKTLLFQF